VKLETTGRKIVLIGLLSIALCFTGARIARAFIPQDGIRCQGCHVTPGLGELLPQYAGNQGCINCHSSEESSTTYELDLGGGPPVETVTVPVVNYAGSTSTAPTTYLAGGNFWWVKEGNEGADDTKGHNVFLGEPDDNFVWDDQIPGMSNGIGGCGGGENSCHYDLSMENTFISTRQGCTKCHMIGGPPDEFGPVPGTEPKGYHHADDSNTVVGSELDDQDGYFRMLSGHFYGAGAGHGVCGIEDDTWEATSDSSDHNEYLGNEAYLAAPAGFGGSSGLGHTMTAFCGGCHGNFHVQECLPAQQPPCYGNWVRHVAGAVLPDSGEFASYTTFDPDAPVARPDLTGWTGPSSTVTPGTDLVNCLSCHRAHGSPYPKMVRWDFSGCKNCHTNK
jgi:predicted CXXCH cytochrome family protein